MVGVAGVEPIVCYLSPHPDGSGYMQCVHGLIVHG